MIIETEKNITRFYIRKKDEERFVRLLRLNNFLKNEPYYWSRYGYFFIYKVLSPSEITRIEKQYLNAGRYGIITGYKGCALTGHDFNWKTN